MPPAVGNIGHEQGGCAASSKIGYAMPTRTTLRGWAPPHPVLNRPQQAAQSTPFQYDSGSRFGTLNIQGFAGTLTLKNSIQLMEEHKLDGLFVTETKSTSY